MKIFFLLSILQSISSCLALFLSLSVNISQMTASYFLMDHTFVFIRFHFQQLWNLEAATSERPRLGLRLIANCVRFGFCIYFSNKPGGLRRSQSLLCSVSSAGGQEVMVNLRNFPPWLSGVLPGSCSLHHPPGLAVIDVTYSAACSHIAGAVQMSGFWLSSDQCTHRVGHFF